MINQDFGYKDRQALLAGKASVTPVEHKAAKMLSDLRRSGKWLLTRNDYVHSENTDVLATFKRIAEERCLAK